MLSFSGGKDSCCIKHLADLAGVDYRPEELPYCGLYDEGFRMRGDD